MLLKLLSSCSAISFLHSARENVRIWYFGSAMCIQVSSIEKELNFFQGMVSFFNDSPLPPWRNSFAFLGVYTGVFLILQFSVIFQWELSRDEHESPDEIAEQEISFKRRKSRWLCLNFLWEFRWQVRKLASFDETAEVGFRYFVGKWLLLLLSDENLKWPNGSWVLSRSCLLWLACW